MSLSAHDLVEADLIIYGGTSAAITAAVQAARMGKSVAVVSPDRNLGGLTSSGLGFADTGRTGAIGGLAREFYHRLWRHYRQQEAWAWQDRNSFTNEGQGTPAMDDQAQVMWLTEPHAAEQVFDAWVAEHDIRVFRNAWLDREHGVQMEDRRITAIRTLDGITFRGKVFLDATYEGDLLAAAGIPYHVGREAQSVYGETWNGIQVGVLHHAHHFGDRRISPFRTPGDPASGLLPGVSGQDPGRRGEGDRRVQAYCYRLCLTDHPGNRIPFAPPEGYDADQYELLLRVLNTGWREVFNKFDRIPNRKTDTNNHGPFSMDFIGENYAYPDASYEARREIVRRHEVYQKGLLYFLANDPRVPADVRDPMQAWGLPADEFPGTGHWPHLLYIREARRMLGEDVMTEHHIFGNPASTRSIGMGSYTLDSHNTQRYVTTEGHVQNEGDIGVHVNQPYQIGYGTIIPRRADCLNLLAPVCLSSSHIAFGSIRMEPVFMVLGQSAATAAVLSLEAESTVQAVDYPALRDRLLADGQRL